ncbi:TIM barrel protein [Ideonella sp. DXS22W]|uniref:TIM barrel protein n=1 Tax=Pseudaquabacterium inlustre TaxID=2984192 RepID=A0ABU9CNP8_9BURK
MKLSAVIEDLYMFNEAGDMPARIRAAAAAGLEKVEFHMWNQVDLDAVAAALKETGVHLQSITVGPRVGCVDRSKTDFIREALQRTIATCQRLGATDMIIAGGPALKDASAAEQHAAMVHNLKHLAPVAADAGMRLLLEPLNTRVDHPGFFMASAIEGLDIVEEVNHPAVRLLYDAYHAEVMGEDHAQILQRAHLIGYVQVADTNGRHEPGTGTIDWATWLPALTAAGYTGDIGLEYRPSNGTLASLQRTRQVFGMA